MMPIPLHRLPYSGQRGSTLSRLIKGKKGRIYYFITRAAPPSLTECNAGTEPLTACLGTVSTEDKGEASLFSPPCREPCACTYFSSAYLDGKRARFIPYHGTERCLFQNTHRIIETPPVHACTACALHFGAYAAQILFTHHDYTTWHVNM